MSSISISRTRVRFTRVATALAILAIVAGGAAWWSSPDAVRAQTAVVSTPPAGPAMTSYANAVAKVSPAVVTVQVEKKASFEPTSGMPHDPSFRRFFGDRTPSPQRQPRQRGLGSGVIIEADGRIVTNAHVVDGADRVRVVLTDGREFDAKVMGIDKPTDLAVLDVEATGLPTLPFGDSDRPRVGDVVLAVGNPLGVGQTVTMGILSAKGRATGSGDGSYEDFLQTDAPINQGNSGGALVTAQGELIGINSQILSPSGGNIGIGFSIPASMARHVVGEIVDHGEVRRSRMGVTIQPVTADIARSLDLPSVKGALVNGVEPGSPADHAGVKTGDVITKFNGLALDNGNDLRNLVASTAPGSKATVTIVRQGHSQDVAVQLANARREAASARSRSGGASEDDALGVVVEPLTPQLANRLEVPRDTDGVVVTDIDPDGRAADAGLREGDVIRQVDGKAIHSSAELRSALSGRTDRPALVLVQRGDNTFFATVG
ncbi:MAG: DegQ family serine endoprotease [Vicinamibacteria bacterium]|nr:DegQ family serine endoprotease [Vicinamibacteria bacterium]